MSGFIEAVGEPIREALWRNHDHISKYDSWDLAEHVIEAFTDALRAAAGGADRVVLDWSGTPCATCGGRAAERDSGGYVSFCGACGGSGSGDDVVLHGLAAWSTATLDDGYGSSRRGDMGRPATTFPLWRLVPVTPSEATP